MPGNRARAAPRSRGIEAIGQEAMRRRPACRTALRSRRFAGVFAVGASAGSPRRCGALVVGTVRDFLRPRRCLVPAVGVCGSGCQNM